MSNHTISHGKTLYDIFNMINPNCYQALVMQYIIENKKDEAIQCCDELDTAFKYYNWEKKKCNSSYIDTLICESHLEKWQKLSIIHIITNDTSACKNVILNEIEEENRAKQKRIETAQKYMDNPLRQLEDLYKALGFGSLM